MSVLPNELRIGNVTINPTDNKVSIISPEHISDIMLGYKNRDGIPLTPELLEKCGFTKKKFNTEWEWSIKSNECNFKKFDFNESILGGYYFWTLQKVVELKYVHQLQNLYYSLTGEELNIKL